jgi:hypothetical protein
MEVHNVLRKLKAVLQMVLPTVIYARYDYDNEQNTEPPYIIFQDISKKPAEFGDDKPVYYERTIQITLVTKKKDEAIEEKLEKALLEYDYIFSLTNEFSNSDHSINRVYEIRLEEFKHAK